MNQQQLEAWIAQNGGAEGVQFATKTINVKNPAKSPTLDDGSDNPNYDPTAPATIAVQVLAWTNPKTGAAIAVRPNGQDAYEVVEQTGAKPGASATDPAARNAEELQRQREKNAALPPDQDPSYETDAERRARAEAKIKEQGAAKPLSPIISTRTEKDEATGRTVTVNTHQDGTETRAETNVTKAPPTPTKVGSQWGYWDTTKTPPVWTPLTGAPGEPVRSKPVQAEDGSWGTWVQASADATPTWEPVQGPPAGTGATRPAGVPPWTLPPPGSTPQQIIRAVNDRWNELNDLVNQGIIKPEQAKNIFASEHATATALAADATNRASSGLTERSQDISLTTSRAGTATSIFNSPLAQNAATAGGKLIPKPGSGQVAARGLMALLQMGGQFVNQMGGQATIPSAGSYAQGQGATNTGGMPGINIFMGQQPQPGTSVPAMAGAMPPAPSQGYGGVPVLPAGLQPPGGFPGGGAGTPLMAPPVQPAPITPEPMPSVLPHEDVLNGFMQEIGG